MYGDVSNLMGCMLRPGDNDDFGKEPGQRTVLTLNRIIGTVRTFESRFLNLPVEILADIIVLLANDTSSLANLALVNLECRQIARSAQFAEVVFNYSPRSFALLGKLSQEAKASATYNSQPRLGSCIRRVVVQSQRHWVATKHDELFQSIYGKTRKVITKADRDLLEADANQQYIKNYRDPVLDVIASLPNLESLAWKEKLTSNEHCVKLICHSKMQHLKLTGLTLDEPYLLTPPLTPSTLPLRSLHIDIGLVRKDVDSVNPENEELFARYLPDYVRKEYRRRDLAVTIGSLLRLCAPTLGALDLSGLCASVYAAERTLDIGALEFSSLRSFRLIFLSVDSGFFRSILSSPLRELELDCVPKAYEATLTQCLRDCDALPGLQAFVVDVVRENTAASIGIFLATHQYIEKLMIGESSAELLRPRILPQLTSGRFRHLSSLALHWEGPGIEDRAVPNIATIPSDDLAAIGSLQSLEQLCLTAGEALGWRCQWLINHEDMRTHLQGLGNLKKLAFCRDTYPLTATGHLIDFAHVEMYYEATKYPTFDDEDRARERPWVDREMDYFTKATRRDAERRRERLIERRLREEERREAAGEPELDDNDEDPGEDAHEGSEDQGEEELEDPYSKLSKEEIWELSHRNLILREMEKYAAVLTNLRWMYCGQWPTEIIVPGTGVFGNAHPLSDARDSCRTTLAKTFGLGGDEE